MRCIVCDKELEAWERPQPVVIFDGDRKKRFPVDPLCDQCARENSVRVRPRK